MVKEAIWREARRQKGWRKQWARLQPYVTPPPLVKIAIAWLVMWACFAALAAIAITFAFVFGPERTRLLLFSWTFAEGQTLFLEVRERERARRCACQRCYARARAHTARRCMAHARAAAEQEPLIIAMTIVLPYVMDALTANGVIGEVFNEVFANVVGAVVASFKSGVQAITGGA